MKPKCKAETKWKYWREENCQGSNLDKFTKWAKIQMNRARRRFNKQIQNYELD